MICRHTKWKFLLVNLTNQMSLISETSLVPLHQTCEGACSTWQLIPTSFYLISLKELFISHALMTATFQFIFLVKYYKNTQISHIMWFSWALFLCSEKPFFLLLYYDLACHSRQLAFPPTTAVCCHGSGEHACRWSHPLQGGTSVKWNTEIPHWIHNGFNVGLKPLRKQQGEIKCVGSPFISWLISWLIMCSFIVAAHWFTSVYALECSDMCHHKTKMSADWKPTWNIQFNLCS